MINADVVAEQIERMFGTRPAWVETYAVKDETPIMIYTRSKSYAIRIFKGLENSYAISRSHYNMPGHWIVSTYDI